MVVDISLNAGGARLAGIKSRDDAPPHGHAAWRGHAVRARRFRARRKRERVSATPIERHQEVAEAMSRGAEPGEARLHEGASKPAADACRLSPVWNTGRLAAMNTAAGVGAERYAPRNAVNTVP